MNDAFNLSKLDFAVQERIFNIPFDTVFTMNPTKAHEKKIDITLKNKLLNENYRNEFMLLLLDAYSLYLKGMTGKIAMPAIVTEKTNEYFNNNNPVGAFLKD